MSNSNSELFMMPQWAGVRLAIVFSAMAVVMVVAGLSWGFGMRIWDAVPGNFMAAICMAGIAWGCLSRQRWAWSFGILISGMCSVFSLLSLPMAINRTFFTTPPSLLGPQQTNVGYVMSYFYVSSVFVALMFIAFIFFLLRSTREAFGIGKAAQV